MHPVAKHEQESVFRRAEIGSRIDPHRALVGESDDERPAGSLAIFVFCDGFFSIHVLTIAPEYPRNVTLAVSNASNDHVLRLNCINDDILPYSETAASRSKLSSRLSQMRKYGQ